MPGSAPDDFGASLRAAREARGLTLRQISETTKISVGVLQSLERNDVANLPGGLFSRSFVRAYAAEVGLNPEATVERFLDSFPERRPDATGPRRRDTPVAAPPLEPPTETSTVIRLVLMSIPVVALLLFFGLRGGEPEAPSIGEGAQVDEQARPEVAPPDPSLQDPPAPTAPTPQPAADPPDAAAAAAGSLILALRPTGPCWVSLIVDGEPVWAGVVDAGQPQVFEAEEGFVLEIGDAGLFEFTINDQPGRSLGRSGQPVTVEIDHDNYRTFLALE